MPSAVKGRVAGLPGKRHHGLLILAPRYQRLGDLLHIGLRAARPYGGVGPPAVGLAEPGGAGEGRGNLVTYHNLI